MQKQAMPSADDMALQTKQTIAYYTNKLLCTLFLFSGMTRLTMFFSCISFSVLLEDDRILYLPFVSCVQYQYVGTAQVHRFVFAVTL